MRRALVAMLLLSVGVASAQQEQEKPTFPTKDQIVLLLTQSERAFDTYEQTLKLEVLAGGDIAKTVPKDEEVLKSVRDLITRLKKSPDGFNGPAGFLLVGDLDDGSRNMAVCMGQAAMQSSAQAQVGNLSEATRYLHTGLACADSSVLLYTVSETAFNLYSDFLLAQDQMTKRAMSQLERCVDFLKKDEKPHKQ
jgi:hypothetical protein